MNWSFLSPRRTIDTYSARVLAGGWVGLLLAIWVTSPSVFLPRPAEVMTALHDLWFYQNLGIELFASVRLNLESIALASAISLVLAYASMIPAFRIPAMFIGKLRFLSLVGLSFVFTLLTTSGHQLKVSILVFSVTVFFVVSMMDVIAAIPQEQYDLARTLRMGDWETLYEVVILGQIDQAFVVLRQNAAMSWLMLSVVETMSRSGGGIGAMLMNSNRHFHLAEVFAIQAIILLLGLAQDYALGAARRLCCPYVEMARRS